MSDRLQVGYVKRAHGRRGELRITPTTDHPEQRFAEGESLGLGETQLEIAEARPLPDGDWLLLFGGVDSRATADSHRGAELWITRDQIELAEHEWLRDDLVGCTLLVRNGENLGRVASAENTGSNDILVLEDGRLIPLVAHLNPAVDLGAKEITIDPPEES